MNKFMIVFTVLFSFSLFSVEPVILLMGGPGSGKGTFSQHLKECYGYHHVSCGDLVRNEIDQGTPIGMEIQEAVKRGEFIPPFIMHTLLYEAVKGRNAPLIIDGFGRKAEDIEYLSELLVLLDLKKVAIGVMLEADDELSKERISSRQICSNCGHVYNTKTAPSKLRNSCELCISPLKLRLNDTPEIIAKRVKDYRDKIEEYQRMAISLFPNITFQTNDSIDKCLQKYSRFAEAASSFEDVESFIDHFKTVSGGWNS